MYANFVFPLYNIFLWLVPCNIEFLFSSSFYLVMIWTRPLSWFGGSTRVISFWSNICYHHIMNKLSFVCTWLDDGKNLKFKGVSSNEIVSLESKMSLSFNAGSAAIKFLDLLVCFSIKYYKLNDIFFIVIVQFHVGNKHGIGMW
jgi:hypothetical protein